MRPFTSHDGEDSQGVRAEVHVQVGNGTVKGFTISGDKEVKNVLVKMNVEGLKHPVQGWTLSNDPIYKDLQEAKESGREVSYRIESQRKRGIDRNIPIAELRQKDVANENVRSIFAGVDGKLSSEAVTHPSEDPHDGDRIPASDPSSRPKPSPSGSSFSVEQALAGLKAARQGGLPQGVVDNAAALALAAGASVDEVVSAGVVRQGNSKPSTVRRTRSVEAAPFVEFNTDGRPNLGSYAVLAAVGAESFAADLLHAKSVEMADQHNEAVKNGEIEGHHNDPVPVNYKQAAAFGKVLLMLADEVQTNTYGGGNPDRMCSSHTRCRGLVYDTVKNLYSIPLGKTTEEQEIWKRQVVDEASARFARILSISNYQMPSEETTGSEETSSDNQNRESVTEASSQPVSAPVSSPVRNKPPVAGEDGFIEPSDEIIQRFAGLASAAGFEPTPGSPVMVYLDHKFGVSRAKQVHGPALDSLVSWYENQDDQGVSKFREHVETEVAGQ